MKLKVQCTLEIEIDWKDEWYDPFFTIEENGCPGTGSVGAAFDELYEECEKQFREQGSGPCWACNLGGENKIIEVDGAPVTEELRARIVAKKHEQWKGR